MNQEYMLLVLERLNKEFGVDVSEADGLEGQELADWIEETEEALFQRLHAELRAQR